jgi:hypothetical protein
MWEAMTRPDDRFVGLAAGVVHLGDIGLDSRSTVVAAMQADLIRLRDADGLDLETAVATIVLGLARLEACIFGDLEDPSVT